MSERVLVTGGAGFIGSHLVRRLTELGRLVRVFELPTAHTAHLGSTAEIISGDITDRAAVVRAVADCAEVYHLAANPHLWARPKAVFRRVNYLGTVNVLKAALASGARRILHTSTESILSRKGQTVPIVEDQSVELRDAIGPYCRSKLLAERFALRLARAGAPIIIVNPTLPVGPGDWGRSPPTQMMIDFCRGGRREYLEANLNLIDVRDVAEGMVLALRRGRPGQRYLLAAENLSIREVFVILARLTGFPGPRWRVPYPVALAAAYLNEGIADLITRRAPVATVTGVRLAGRELRFDPRRTLDELGLKPRPVSAALSDAVQWFRQIGWLK